MSARRIITIFLEKFAAPVIYAKPSHNKSKMGDANLFTTFGLGSPMFKEEVKKGYDAAETGWNKVLKQVKVGGPTQVNTYSDVVKSAGFSKIMDKSAARDRQFAVARAAQTDPATWAEFYSQQRGVSEAIGATVYNMTYERAVKLGLSPGESEEYATSATASMLRAHEQMVDDLFMPRENKTKLDAALDVQNTASASGYAKKTPA